MSIIDRFQSTFCLVTVSVDGVIITSNDAFQQFAGTVVDGSTLDSIIQWDHLVLPKWKLYFPETFQSEDELIPFSGIAVVEGKERKIEIVGGPSENHGDGYLDLLIREVEPCYKKCDVNNLYKNALQLGKFAITEIVAETKSGGEFTFYPSEEWKSLTGLEQDTLSFEDFISCIDSKSLSRTIQLRENILNGKDSWENEVQLSIPGHTKRWFQSFGGVVERTSDKLHAVIIYHDITETKKHLEELGITHRSLNFAMELAELGEMKVFFDTDMVVFDSRAAKQFGVDPNIQMSWQDFINNIVFPQDLEWGLQFLETRLMEDKPFFLEYRIRHSDGSIRWIRQKVYSIQNSQGISTKAVAVGFDITESKMLEQERLEYREHLEQQLMIRTRELLEAQRIGRMGSWVINQITGEEEFSQNMVAIHQKDPEKFDGTLADLGDEIFEEDQKRMISLFSQDFSEDTQGEEIIRQNRKDGVGYLQIRWEVTVSDGVVQTLKGTTQDITSSERAFAALRKKEEQLQNAQRIARLGYWEFYADSTSIDWSEETFRIFALDSTEYPHGISIEEFNSFLLKDDRQRVWKIFNKTIIEQTEHRIEHKIILRDRSVKYVVQNITVQSDKEGKVYCAGTLMDITPQKIVEKQLLAGEERYRAIFESSSAIVLFGFDGEILNANSSFCEVFEYESSDDLRGISILDLTLKSERDKARDSLHELIHTEYYPVTYEIPYLTKTGKELLGNMSISLCPGNEHDEPFFVTVFRDITIEREMQLRLAENEERFRTVADFTFDWEYWIGEDDMFRYISPSVEKMTEYSVEFFDTQGFTALVEVVHPEDRDEFIRHYHETPCESDGRYEKSFRIITKSGTVKWISHACQAIIRDGVFCGHRASNRDITEQKNLLNRIAESEQRFSQIANSIEEIFWLISMEGEIQVVNSALSRVLGYAESVIGLNFWELPLWQESDSHLIHKVFQNFTDQEEPHFHIETEWLKANGEVAICRNNISTVQDGNGIMTNLAIVSQDITLFRTMANKEKMHQEQLRQADKMSSLGVLVSGVAHEINNPNNMIMLNSGFLQKVWDGIYPILDREASVNTELKLNNLPYPVIRKKLPELIEGISMGSDRIKEIVKGLKDFSRVDTGLLDSFFDINMTVNNAVRIVQNTIKNATHNFTIDLTDDVPQVKGNSQQIEQVIINLLTNSCQALSSPDKAITISSYYKENTVYVVVKDEGEGISKESLKKIRDPFFTTKRDHGGTGLGLSVSYMIMDNHKGYLDYHSVKGEGTTASMVLPLSSIEGSEDE